MTSAAPGASVRPRLALLDCLRFAAALAVVASHWLSSGISTGTVQSIELSPVAGIASYGYLGVYLFFLISGFVISASARGKSAAQFAVGRLVRLFPTYWAAMLITAAVAAFLGSTVMTITFPQVLANLTMVSRIFGQTYVDSVYWTLFLELAFYAFVFILIFLGLGNRLDRLFPAWSAIVAAIAFLAPTLRDEMLIGGIFALFVGGAIIAGIQRLGWSWPRAIGLALSVAAAERYVLDDLAINQANQSPIAIAVIVAVFYGLILLQIVPSVGRWRIPMSQTFGAWTYPLYLLHAQIGYMIFANFSNESNKWIVYAITFALMIFLSFLLHQVIEVRQRKFWKRVFESVVGIPVSAISRFAQNRLPWVITQSPVEPGLPRSDTRLDTRG